MNNRDAYHHHVKALEAVQYLRTYVSTFFTHSHDTTDLETIQETIEDELAELIG